MTTEPRYTPPGAPALVVLDATLLVCAFALAFVLRNTVALPQEPHDIGEFVTYLGFLSVQVVTVLLVFFFSRLYHLVRGASRVDMFAAVGGGISIGTLVAVGVSTLAFRDSMFDVELPRMMIVYAWVLGVLLVVAGRLSEQSFTRALYRNGLGRRERVLIVGTGEAGRLIAQKIVDVPHLGYQFVGFVGETDPPASVQAAAAPLLGSYDALPMIISEHAIDEVIIALPETSRQDIVSLIASCDRSKVGIQVFPDMFQIITSQVSVGDLAGLPLLTVRDIALRGWKLTLKRAVDLAGSAVGLIFLSPFMLITAILIRLESRGPVFYCQERMGLDGKPFQIIKFRSMRLDAESGGPGWTVENDPRVTRIGKFIRKNSIDEFPQFINVLLGEMSLVGPRPERPVYVERFRQSIPRYMERHREKAGITGWAQVNGLRGDTSISERTKYDLWYVENWSIWLDFKIMILTILRVLADRNAY